MSMAQIADNKSPKIASHEIIVEQINENIVQPLLQHVRPVQSQSNQLISCKDDDGDGADKKLVPVNRIVPHRTERQPLIAGQGNQQKDQQQHQQQKSEKQLQQHQRNPHYQHHHHHHHYNHNHNQKRSVDKDNLNEKLQPQHRQHHHHQHHNQNHNHNHNHHNHRHHQRRHHLQSVCSQDSNLQEFAKDRKPRSKSLGEEQYLELYNSGCLDPNNADEAGGQSTSESMDDDVLPVQSSRNKRKYNEVDENDEVGGGDFKNGCTQSDVEIDSRRHENDTITGKRNFRGAGNANNVKMKRHGFRNPRPLLSKNRKKKRNKQFKPNRKCPPQLLQIYQQQLLQQYGHKNSNINHQQPQAQIQHQHQHQPQQQPQQTQQSHNPADQKLHSADTENMACLKNTIQNHRKHVQQAMKTAKAKFKKINPQRLAPFSLRSKFFLPEKMQCKDTIMPPTKFLLGGNISDPLNLNSLQDEALNQTPHQSPITTPPKVEVIIPPNIHDPLHLLDPVDSLEYEKQLVSPMKRKSKSKHRNRKKKPRRKRLDNSTSSSISLNTTSSIVVESSANIFFEKNTDNVPAPQIETPAATESGAGTTSASVPSEKTIFGEVAVIPESNEKPSCGEATENVENKSVPSSTLDVAVVGSSSVTVSTTIASVTATATLAPASNPLSPAGAAPISSAVPNSIVRRSVDRERATRDLRLDLGIAVEYAQNHQQKPQQQHHHQHHHHPQQQHQHQHQQQHQQHQQQLLANPNGGRKRKVSEGPNSIKNKFRRMDSMDKIVSPVVPQPGAWKRPPRTVPTGARKTSRVHSTSISESELISPTDETKTIESESIRGDTPDVDVQKFLTEDISHNTGDDPDAQQKALLGQHQQQQQQKNTQSQSQQQQQKQRKFKPEDEKYQYGNYDRYSGYRNLNEFMDVRLKVFQQHAHLFRDKDVLDIGCNVGHMTIAVAKNLAPKSIVGIDIDPQLVERARKNVSLFVRIPKERGDRLCSESLPAADEITNQSPTATNKNDVSETSNVTKMQPHSGGRNSEPSCSKTTPNKLPSNSTPNAANQSADAPAAPPTDKTSDETASTEFANPPTVVKVTKSKRNARRKSNQKLKLDRQNIEFFPISFSMCYNNVDRIIQRIDEFRNVSPIHSSSANVTATATTSTSTNTTTTPTTTTATTTKEESSPGFPENVSFRTANYVLKDESQINNETQQYDLIICLSITKWIHLNFGDSALKLAFKRMFNQLRPGGKLILEAQNWASYKKKKNLTETIYKNYRSIEFFPNKFHEYLLGNEVGFSHSYTMGVPRHLSKGFCRPIQMYAKGDFTPTHVNWSDNYNPQTPREAYSGIYASMMRPPHRIWSFGTPRGWNSGRHSTRQTPLYAGLSTSQYYNPLESDSYLPSYDTTVPNRHYCFASPLYQTVWSPPASLRNSSTHQSVSGSSARETDAEEGASTARHVYIPNSPQTPNSACNSIRESDNDDVSNQQTSQRRHVYANCDNSSSPKVNGIMDSSPLRGAAAGPSVVVTSASNTAVAAPPPPQQPSTADGGNAASPDDNN